MRLVDFRFLVNVNWHLEEHLSGRLEAQAHGVKCAQQAPRRICRACLCVRPRVGIFSAHVGGLSCVTGLWCSVRSTRYARPAERHSQDCGQVTAHAYTWTALLNVNANRFINGGTTALASFVVGTGNVVPNSVTCQLHFPGASRGTLAEHVGIHLVRLVSYGSTRDQRPAVQNHHVQPSCEVDSWPAR